MNKETKVECTIQMEELCKVCLEPVVLEVLQMTSMKEIIRYWKRFKGPNLTGQCNTI